MMSLIKHAGKAKVPNVKGSENYPNNSQGDTRVDDVGAGREHEHLVKVQGFVKEYVTEALRDNAEYKVGLGNEPKSAPQPAKSATVEPPSFDG
jgi:hypothetical protein